MSIAPLFTQHDLLPCVRARIERSSTDCLASKEQLLREARERLRTMDYSTVSRVKQPTSNLANHTAANRPKCARCLEAESAYRSPYCYPCKRELQPTVRYAASRDPKVVERVRTMVASGTRSVDIARALGMCEQTLQKLRRDHGIGHPCVCVDCHAPTVSKYAHRCDACRRVHLREYNNEIRRKYADRYRNGNLERQRAYRAKRHIMQRGGQSAA